MKLLISPAPAKFDRLGRDVAPEQVTIVIESLLKLF
jgi:hypothetical protein